MTVDERAVALGLEIPEIPELPFRPKLRPVLVHGGLAYISGIGPIGVSGRVGEDVSVEDGYAAARTTALYALRRILAGRPGADLNWVPDYAEGTALDAADSIDTRQSNVVSWLKELGASSTKTSR